MSDLSEGFSLLLVLSVLRLRGVHKAERAALSELQRGVILLLLKRYDNILQGTYPQRTDVLIWCACMYHVPLLPLVGAVE